MFLNTWGPTRGDQRSPIHASLGTFLFLTQILVNNWQVQDCILEAFHSPEIGGVKGLIEWGQPMSNREAFYKLIARLIPKPNTTVNVDVGTEPKIDWETRLREARKRIEDIRNEDQDPNIQTHQSGNVTHTVISNPNRKDQPSS